MKKLTLAAAAFGLVMLTACDDSSSSANDSANKDSQGRTIYTNMEDALGAPCSDANKCEVIIMNDVSIGVQDTLQCNGSAFMSMLNGPLAVCSTSSSSEATPIVAESSSSEATPVVVESSSSEATPVVIESSSSEATPIIAESSSSEATPVVVETSSSSVEAGVESSSSYTVYTDMVEALQASCSDANKCEIIVLDDASMSIQDTLQCNGSNFMSMNGSSVAGCAN